MVVRKGIKKIIPINEYLTFISIFHFLWERIAFWLSENTKQGLKE